MYIVKFDSFREINDLTKKLHDVEFMEIIDYRDTNIELFKRYILDLGLRYLTYRINHYFKGRIKVYNITNRSGVFRVEGCDSIDYF